MAEGENKRREVEVKSDGRGASGSVENFSKSSEMEDQGTAACAVSFKTTERTRGTHTCQHGQCTSSTPQSTTSMAGHQ